MAHLARKAARPRLRGEPAVDSTSKPELAERFPHQVRSPTLALVKANRVVGAAASAAQAAAPRRNRADCSSPQPRGLTRPGRTRLRLFPRISSQKKRKSRAGSPLHFVDLGTGPCVGGCPRSERCDRQTPVSRSRLKGTNEKPAAPPASNKAVELTLETPTDPARVAGTSKPRPRSTASPAPPTNPTRPKASPVLREHRPVPASGGTKAPGLHPAGAFRWSRVESPDPALYYVNVHNAKPSAGPPWAAGPALSSEGSYPPRTEPVGPSPGPRVVFPPPPTPGGVSIRRGRLRPRVPAIDDRDGSEGDRNRGDRPCGPISPSRHEPGRLGPTPARA